MTDATLGMTGATLGMTGGVLGVTAVVTLSEAKGLVALGMTDGVLAAWLDGRTT
jgi:hypothetical protein